MTEVEALGLLLRSVQGRRSTYNADVAEQLIAEYEDRGGLHVERQRVDGHPAQFVRIGLTVTSIERPHWWADDEGNLT